jgi:predicted heme/steroid binding protein
MDGLLKQKIIMQLEEEKPMEFTYEELAWFDGKDGRPAYIAVLNVVYDVSEFPSWKGGIHFGILAGTDATEEFIACHSHQVIEKLKIVGVLVE